MGGHSTGSGAAPRPYDAVVQALLDGFVDLMFRGGFVMWPLLALSVLMVTLTIERSFFWVNLHGRRGRARFARLVDALRRGQRGRVEAIRAERPDVYSDLAESLVRLGPTDPNAVAASEEVRPRIDRFLGTLATIVTAAPLLGILGTVSGIIGAGLVLADAAGGEVSVLADGAFLLPNKVPAGTAYAVTVKTQPSGPTQTCEVTGGTGVVVGGNVTTVVVSCASNRFAGIGRPNR